MDLLFIISIMQGAGFGGSAKVDISLPQEDIPADQPPCSY